PRFATKVQCVRDESGHPVMPLFQVDALRRPAHQTGPPIVRSRTNRDSRISLVHVEARHNAAMLPESGTALEKIRYHRLFATVPWILWPGACETCRPFISNPRRLHADFRRTARSRLHPEGSITKGSQAF